MLPFSLSTGSSIVKSLADSRSASPLEEDEGGTMSPVVPLCAASVVSNTASSLEEESIVSSSATDLDGGSSLRGLDGGSSLRALDDGSSLRALDGGSGS